MELELNEVIVKLIDMVGVGNFILIIVSMALVVNLPTIITKIVGLFTSNKKEKDLQRVAGFIETKLKDLDDRSKDIEKDVTDIENTLKHNTEEVKELRTDLKSVNTERREENMMIIDTMENMLNSILSIKNVMKNVMNEEDATRLVSYLLGIFNNFSTSLFSKTMNAIESFENIEDEDLNQKTLKNEIDSCWSDLKIEIARFNTPIKLKPFLDSYDDTFWSKEGMFKQIVKLSTSNSDLQIIKESIKKQIDIGLRQLFNQISESLENNRS